MPVPLTDSGTRNAASPNVIEITDACPQSARRLSQSIEAIGGAARIVDRPSQNAICAVYTEGMTDGAATAFHTQLLDAAQKNLERTKNAAARSVFLQAEDGADSAWRNGLPGLTRTLCKEYPAHRSMTVSLPTQIGADAPVWRQLAHLVQDPLLGDTLHINDDGNVSKPALETVSTRLPMHVTGVDSNDVFLVTGGGQGITAACTTALAERSGANFVLIGRTQPVDWPDWLAAEATKKDIVAALAKRDMAAGLKPDPKGLGGRAAQILASRSIRQTITNIQRAGGAASYRPLDLGDHSSVAAALTSISRTEGRITGLIHGAGVLSDKRLADMQADDVERVFLPKVSGLQTLLDLCPPSGLRHIALFSSAAARFGNVGQANYAMANAVLSAVGADLAARYPRLNVKVFEWGPWDGGMVSDSLKSAFAARGIDIIQPDIGASLFAELMLARLPTPNIVIGQL